MLTYGELAAASNRFANALVGLGVQPGARVFVLLGRTPELYVAALGALKARCVVSPLFSAFGPEPIATRVEMGDGRVLVTASDLYRRKVEGLRERLTGLRHVILTGAESDERRGLLGWADLVDGASPDFTIAPTDAEEMALLHFTSGTTGRPKGATEGDPEVGRDIAQEHCVRCHDISPAGEFKTYPPSFASIAVYRDVDQIRSRIAFPQLHSAMPQMIYLLDTEDVADLVAYITSLEAEPE